MRTKVKLDLGRHCIETEIKKLYNQFLADYFKADSDKESLEKKIDLLQKALQYIDFGSLRSAHPQLAGDCRAPVFIMVDDDERMVISIEEQDIRPVLTGNEPNRH